MIHKFPFKDEVLIHGTVCNFNNIENCSFSSIEYFLDKFSAFLKGDDLNDQVEKLQTAFCNLQITEVPEKVKNEERINSQWALLR